MTGMDDLVTWLRAQLDEDERVARQVTAEPGGFYIEAETPDVNIMTIGAHVYRWTPKRVLAEVDAKRRIIAFAGVLSAPIPTPLGYPAAARAMKIEVELAEENAAAMMLKLLALPYADRPGYLRQWRPDALP